MEIKTKECFEYCLEWLKKNRDEPESFMERMEEFAKPELKPVDVRMLAKSGIDCEFRFDKMGGFEIGQLSDAESIGYVVAGSFHNVRFNRCRPRMNHWHNWQGGECPLPEGLMIEIMFRDGDIAQKVDTSKMHKPSWKNTTSKLKDADIIAFKVIGLAPGYKWPWE